MIITGKNCVLFNSVQEFIKIEAWLLLTFFICLQSIKSIVTYLRAQMFKNSDSSYRQKMNDCSFQQLSWQNMNWFLS